MNDKVKNQADYIVAISAMFAFIEFCEKNSDSLESKKILAKSSESLRKAMKKFSKTARTTPLVDKMVGGFYDVFAHAQSTLEQQMRELSAQEQEELKSTDNA